MNYFELKNVSYRYPDGTTALHNISLHIPKNKKIAILGKNGSGKSTLFQLLIGLMKPTEGEILFNGSPIQYGKKALKELRQQVGIVFQDADNQLFANTVREDVAIGPANLNWSREEIIRSTDEALRLTELEQIADKPIHFLSGGQKKRVTLAGVYAMRPNIYILDEPTSSLDYYFSKQLMHYLQKLHEDGRTFLYATHQINLVYDWADYYIVLDEGQIKYTGDAIGLFQNEALLAQAHLEKPFAFQLAERLIQLQRLNAQQAFQLSTEQLLQAIK